MNGGNWSGKAEHDADIIYEVDIAASPMKNCCVEFKVREGDKGTHVAKELEEAWNKEFKDGPSAARVGATVELAGTVHTIRVNGREVDAGGAIERVTNAPGLYVCRDAP